MANEMIERVARALCRLRVEENNKARPKDQKRSEDFMQRVVDAQYINFWQEAKAAIAAMREPTDQQRNNYYNRKFEMFENERDCVFVDAEWENMIDAALKED